MGTPRSAAYSFLDVFASITGDGIAHSFTGHAQEGYSIMMGGTRNTLVVGAGGDGMNSLRAGRNGSFHLRLLKTSLSNQILSDNFAYQAASAATWGKNVILVRDSARGDTINISGAAYSKFPDNGYGENGNIIEWVWDATFIDSTLGAGA